MGPLVIGFILSTWTDGDRRCGDISFFDSCEEFAHRVEKNMDAVVVIFGARMRGDGTCEASV